MADLATRRRTLGRIATSVIAAALATTSSLGSAAAADAVPAPNDPLWSSQWSLSAQPSVGINLLEAWRYSRGAGVVVAVVDTGITDHPEFKGRVLPGYDFVSNERSAGDGDGRDADPSDPGDYVSEEDIAAGGQFANCTREDSSWHGTHVAGIILAAANNKVGIAGIAPEARLLPVRALGKCGGSDNDLIDALRWAAGLSVPNAPANANPAKVINVSLGGEGACTPRLQGAVDEISALGAVIVVSTGNSNRDASLFSPANCRGTLTVGATTSEGLRASYSNFGSYVDLSAPGGDDRTEILSSVDTGARGPEGPTYKAYSGTSMSTPHVSGALALALSLDPLLPLPELLGLLLSTSAPFVGDGSSLGCTQQPLCGAGNLDAGALISTIANRPLPSLSISGALSMAVNSTQGFLVSLDEAPAPLTLDTPDLCRLEEGVLSALARGTCVLSFTQGSTAKYKPVTTQILIKLIGTEANIQTSQVRKVKIGAVRSLGASTSSDGALRFKSLTPATCSVTASGSVRGRAAGKCRVRIRVAGTAVYEPVSAIETLSVVR